MLVKIASVLFILLKVGGICFSQEDQHRVCDADFRPLYMRTDLPSGMVYANANASAEDRVKDVIKQLTFDEKLALTGGWKNMYFPGVERLGLMPVYFADASQGVHEKNICINIDHTTSFPCELALAATWNTDLAYQYAKAIGEECRAWGVNVLLGPGMNMYRNAEGGRNFEYLGEDPLLASKISVSYVQGLQSTGTIATVKHFIGNEQELARHVINVNIGERALREIYLPPFEASIKEGGALAVMTGNNQVNGYPGAANRPLVKNYLRDELGFKGVVMSDWANSMYWTNRHHLELGSGHSLLMADNKLFADYIKEQIKKDRGQKALIEKQLDQMVFSNLYTFFKAGVYDRYYRDTSLIRKIEDHREVAVRTAEEAITLLKNENNMLPLIPSKVRKIVVLGSDTALNVYCGKGSGAVKGFGHVNYWEGLKRIYGNKIVRSDKVTDEEIKAADAVLYFLQKTVGEGRDYDFNMDDRINRDILRVSRLNPNIVAVYSSGNAANMPWLPHVKGLVYAYLLGQYSGIALANVMSGVVNPSGKLPFTIEEEFEDSPAKDFNLMNDGKYYWGGNRQDSKEIQEKFGQINIDYKEGIYIGYRWYDKNKINPLFPFGFGLSYTRFHYSDMSLSSASVSPDKKTEIKITLKNTGEKDGADVCQLYLHPLGGSIDRPEKELKAFQKVFLKAGETKTIALQISYNDFSYWSEGNHRWETPPGNYEIWIGNSSKNIFLKEKIMLSR